MLKTESQTSPIIAQAVLRKRLYAFAVTGLAVFVLACLVWPLTVTQFRSVAAVNVSGDVNGSEVELNNALARLIREETSNDQLDAFLAQIESSGVRQSKRFEYRDHDWIRSVLKVGLNQQAVGWQLQLAIDGEGGEDERELVNLLALRVAQRFSVEQRFGADQVASNSVSAQLKSFDEADWILTQIENDLETLRTTSSAVASSATHLPSTADQSSGNDNGSGFQFASSSKVVSNGGDSLQQAIESIDTRSLRSVLTEMGNRIRDQQNTVELNHPGSASLSGEAGLNVQSLNLSRTMPLNGSPGPGILFLLGLFSVVIGTVIARAYDPFEARGFDTVDTLGRTLGVPVVVELKSESESLDNKEADSIRAAWSNRIVKTAGFTLFGVFLVVIGFVLANPEVRHAFAENPLNGCARIFRIFAGY